MIGIDTREPGRFCWLDLAATDVTCAIAFYGALFGWQARKQVANDGGFMRMRLSGRDVGSVYQLHHKQIDSGLASHWTPYIKVDDVDRVAQRVPSLGGRVVVPPFTVTGIARIALIADSIGAHVGLWQSSAANEEPDRHEQGA